MPQAGWPAEARMSARSLALFAILVVAALHVQVGTGAPALPALLGPQTEQTQPPAGFKRCGDPNLVLVFLNPDLKPDPKDQLIHASGTFFIQFQARGDDALKVEKFT